MVARPYVPESVHKRHAWTGIPGAEHVPASDDPAFPHFVTLVADWMQAGVEMTAEYVSAAAKLAAAQVARAKERALIEKQQAARTAKAVSEVPPPGTYGDAPGGVVYYIRRGDYVKIGTTTNLRTRMRDLMPDEVLAVEPGSYKREGQLHQRFAHIRLHPTCEYFRLTAELRAHIASVLAESGSPPEGLHQFKDFTAGVDS